MEQIHSPEPDAPYGFEDAETQVMYFLANAQYWRGETAKTIKKNSKTNTTSNEKDNLLNNSYLIGNGIKLILQTYSRRGETNLPNAGSCKRFGMEPETKAGATGKNNQGTSNANQALW